MEKLLAVLKRMATALPYITFLTVLLYLAGREFNTNYWRGVGLPLMATDRQFADMLYDGFLGYILWTGSIFGQKFDPVYAIVVISILGVAMYAGVEWGVGRILARLVARRAKSPKEPLSPRAARFLDGLEKQLLRLFTVTLVLLALPLLVGMTVLTPAVPSIAIGDKGFALATKDVAMYNERFRKLRDGLVDVTFVSVKRAEGEKPVRAIPMECRGDRCAAMTADGPISLPKDSFGEESIARVELTDACYTEAGLAKRRSTASTR